MLRYRFSNDDMPSPPGRLPGWATGMTRIILQIDGLMGNSIYETVCYVGNREYANEICKKLNHSPDSHMFAEILRRAIEAAKYEPIPADD